jgi:hypothetical protein
VDICHNHRVICGDYSAYSPQAASSLAAQNAVKKIAIRRVDPAKFPAASHRRSRG